VRNIRSKRSLPAFVQSDQCQVIIGLYLYYLYVGLVCQGTTPVLPLTSLSLQPSEQPSTTDE